MTPGPGLASHFLSGDSIWVIYFTTNHTVVEPSITIRMALRYAMYCTYVPNLPSFLDELFHYFLSPFLRATPRYSQPQMLEEFIIFTDHNKDHK